jgi:hypothetical protein
MWIEFGRSGSTGEAPTGRDTLQAFVSGLIICVTFLAALVLAGSP